MRGQYYLVARVERNGRLIGYNINESNSEYGARYSDIALIERAADNKLIINAKMVNGALVGIGVQLASLKTYHQEYLAEVTRILVFGETTDNGTTPIKITTVGYKIKNISSNTINICGAEVASSTEVTVRCGRELASVVENSNVNDWLSNGVFVPSDKIVDGAQYYYFSAVRKVRETQIGEVLDGHWVLKPEYKGVFCSLGSQRSKLDEYHKKLLNLAQNSKEKVTEAKLKGLIAEGERAGDTK